jgi:hypothetical protein
MSIYEAAGELEGARPASNGIARRPESRGFPDNRIFRKKCAALQLVKKAPSGFFDKL